MLGSCYNNSLSDSAGLLIVLDEYLSLLAATASSAHHLLAGRLDWTILYGSGCSCSGTGIDSKVACRSNGGALVVLGCWLGTTQTCSI